MLPSISGGADVAAEQPMQPTPTEPKMTHAALLRSPDRPSFSLRHSTARGSATSPSLARSKHQQTESQKEMSSDRKRLKGQTMQHLLPFIYFSR